mmetsp:Transcript_37012/g.81066  ORF Transcript_37012/g.81066 Transcript_37012/m.81066 type:complete len:90 (+) Transcript_37012:255-524(+)
MTAEANRPLLLLGDANSFIFLFSWFRLLVYRRLYSWLVYVAAQLKAYSTYATKRKQSKMPMTIRMNRIKSLPVLSLCLARSRSVCFLFH